MYFLFVQISALFADFEDEFSLVPKKKPVGLQNSKAANAKVAPKQEVTNLQNVIVFLM